MQALTTPGLMKPRIHVYLRVRIGEMFLEPTKFSHFSLLVLQMLIAIGQLLDTIQFPYHGEISGSFMEDTLMFMPIWILQDLITRAMPLKQAHGITLFSLTPQEFYKTLPLDSTTSEPTIT